MLYPFSLSLSVYSGHFRLSSHRRECQPRVARKTTIIVVYNIVEWPPTNAHLLPPIEKEEEEEEEEEVIRAKRLINSRAFRRLFPSPFVHPFRNLFATSIPLRDIAVCKYHVLHPSLSLSLSLLSTLFLSTLPSCLLVNVFGFESRNWVANLARIR